MGTTSVYNSTRSWFDSWVDYYPAGTGDWENREIYTTDYHFDRRSLEACDQMKEDGTIIYTIAYDVSSSEQAHAEAFLLACSSGAEYFKSASDSSALEAAFEAIGESIVSEVIRIKR